MLEIYNEEYRDLLSTTSSAAGGGGGAKHVVSHDAASGVTTVSDLTLVRIDSPERVDSLLAQAMDKRCAAAEFFWRGV